MAPTLVASRTSLPPSGPLRLRPGKAVSVAPSGQDALASGSISFNKHWKIST